MTARLLLDTHIALWTDTDDPRLRASTQRLIEDCWHSGGAICLSAVSVWEIAMLVDADRIELDVPIDAWVTRVLGRPGAEGVPLGFRAAMRSYQLDPFDNRDPADRLLIATAIELGCPLITYDDRIRRFGERYGERYGFSVMG